MQQIYRAYFPKNTSKGLLLDFGTKNDTVSSYLLEHCDRKLNRGSLICDKFVHNQRTAFWISKVSFSFMGTEFLLDPLNEAQIFCTTSCLFT